MSMAPATGRRRHDVPGVYNLRDTGGYRAGAARTRWGKLFRSDALHLLDGAGRNLLTQLGVAHVVDLRSSAEQSAAPSSLDGVDVRVHRLPVFDEAAPGAQADLRLGLGRVYDHIVDERGESLVKAIRVIADARDDEAVLVHCTAGKDRTGLVIALALSAAGADREEVVADYAQTEEHLRGEWAERMLARLRVGGAELPDEVVELVTASPAPLLAGLLERIDAGYGSVSGYLRAKGMTQSELDRLAAVLIDTNHTSETRKDVL